MNKCPLCGNKLEKDLIFRRLDGYSIPVLNCSNCGYSLARDILINSESFENEKIVNAFQFLEEMNKKLCK